MATCTVWKNFSEPVDIVSLINMANRISADTYTQEVSQIRMLIADGKKEEAQRLKQKLPAFTPSGVFNKKRLSTQLDMYSGYIHLDFDKLSTDKLTRAFQVLMADPHTYLCFISPSGNGLKVFAEVDTGPDQHDSSYRHVLQYYENITGVKADEKCKDITRLCFVSWDPDLYHNNYNQKFCLAKSTNIPEKIVEPPAMKPTTPHSSDQYLLLFQQQILFTNQKATYHDGNRNNYVYLLASNCNRAGIPQLDADSLIAEHFDLPPQEIQKAIKSTYAHHSIEFARFANTANLQTPQVTTAEEDHSNEDYLKATPMLPDEIFQSLPGILAAGANAFADKRKRDVFFTGAIAILSGCLPKVTGIYHQERVHPHLFTFIIAPAASGKGVLKNAKRLADKYHQQVLAASRESQTRHEAELADYKLQLNKRRKGDPPAEKPVTPPFRIVFIPADSSHARMIEHLQNNGGQGIICETEADTMSGAKKQDWGDYSPALRSAFHHEKITLTRKTNNEYIEINDPRLAVALSGTPAQAPRLIASAEDGLFSRFLFYAFKNELVWQDPSPANQTVVYNDHFDQLADEVLSMIALLEQSPTEVQLSEIQWQQLNTVFAGILVDVATFTGEDAAGVVFRLGLVLFRMCMIFTAMRKAENAEITPIMYCADQDFHNALAIVKTYLQHSLLMFNNLPKQAETIHFKGGDHKRRFFEALPAEFTRQQATELGAQFKLAPRTVDDMLKNAMGTGLEKLKAGHYRKFLI